MNNKRQIIECVPNFSEGRNTQVIQDIAHTIKNVEGVELLDVDPGQATNRTVITFVGDKASVVDGAFAAIKKASELIDMSQHSGEHPRFGACDVCPFVPVANATMEDCIECAHLLGQRLGTELGLSGYYYEKAAQSSDRQNLATVRSGEYEGLPEKLSNPAWLPDFGPAKFNPNFGVVAVGARDFLIAYNVNLNTKSVRRANSIAFDVREQGRVKREGHPITGKIVRDEEGNALRVPGSCEGVKAIGWYIEEYGLAQISMNITDTSKTSLHKAFEECRASANKRGLRVTGSELVGLVPKSVLLEAGKYFLEKQERSTGVSESEIIHIAVKSLGLDELAPFDAEKKVIEYLLEHPEDQALIQMSLKSFAEQTASESATPGGGSIAAYVGSLGASLGGMVANLSAHKRGWDDRWDEFSNWANKAQEIQEKLLFLVDEDTRSFNLVMDAFKLPKGSEEEKVARSKAIQDATLYAMKVPAEVVHTAGKAMNICLNMVKHGNPNSITDGAVGALCLITCMEGALMNVKINATGLKDKKAAALTIDGCEKDITQAKMVMKDINALLEKALT